MKEYAELVSAITENVICPWSIRSSKELTPQQLHVREKLLRHERIPDEVDVLLINAAYETSLNIRNEDFKTMSIHCSTPDTQVQVRGRLRHDIDTLYLLDKQHEHVSAYFPEQYLDTWLPTEQVHALTQEMNLRSEKGRELKWPSLKKLLEKDGYRTILLAQPLCNILSDNWQNRGFIFGGDEPLSYTAYRRLREKCFSLLEIVGYNNHDFRATFGTQLKESGLTSAQVADLLGHADTRMVETVYARTRHEGVMKNLDAIDLLNASLGHQIGHQIS